MREAVKVGISGVRGVIGESFTPQLAASFAQAFGAFIGRGAVVVGRDTRPSGVMIERAVVAGLQSVGCRPLLAGVIPTPTLLMTVQERGARGGIAITASHNPSDWNALKFISSRGLFLGEIHAEELFDIYHQQEFSLVPEAEIPAALPLDNPVERHFRRILDYVDAEAIRARKFTVAVDCCNGVGALFSAGFLRDQLGCRVVPLFDNPSGAFERDPEPLPKNLSRLCEAVRAGSCDIGFAQDPDGDRLALVTETGEPLVEDLTLAFAVQQVLALHEKGPVAVNLSCSRCVDHVARAAGCEVIRTRIGEINVSEAILEKGAVVGGENNGGVIIPRIHPCRDSFSGMAVILELLAQSGKTLSELRKMIPVFHLIKDKLPVRAGQIPAMYRAVRRLFAGQHVTFLDGIHADLGETWVHVRRSNTEPVVRITVESTSEREGQARLEQVREAILKSH